VCRIVVDLWERQSGIAEALTGLGVEVVVERLEVGDYDVGRGVRVERKTVVDLHLSVQRGRLWRQLDELRRVARLPYLLIEGPTFDIGAVSPKAIRGICLAVIGLGIPVVRSNDVRESALWLSLIADRASGVRPRRDRPVYAQKPKPAREEVPEAMLAAVPGISMTRARALLKEFGSVRGVVSADPEALQRTEGIGPMLAEALAQAVS
jgi:ERCC4-type nuclease